MPWLTPTLKEVRSLVRDHVRGALPGADAMIPNSVLRVLSDSQGALCHLTLQYEDWLALQLIPDTAETEWLDRHGDIWLVNSDGTTGRKMATLAEGVVEFTGAPGAAVPRGARLGFSTSVEYEVTEVTVIGTEPTPAPVRALDPGEIGNLDAGTGITLVTPFAGVNGTAIVVVMSGGADIESDDDLRTRILERIREPPMGGAAHDYIRWAKAVPGVTRAWCAPNEMGIGTVTVRIMCDVLRADNDGFPFEQDCERVAAYLDTVRPVAVKDFWVVGPIKQVIDVDILDLVPDTPDVRAAIEQNIIAMLYALAKPGQTIYAVWKSAAVMNTAEVESFKMTTTADDVMPSAGHMAVLGDINYAISATD